MRLPLLRRTLVISVASSVLFATATPACGGDGDGSATTATDGAGSSGSSGSSGGSGGAAGSGAFAGFAGFAGQGGLGAGGFGGGSGVQQPAICAAYVSCSTKAAPASAAAVLQAYGPGGSCWVSGPAIVADCTTACETGIKQLHPAAPADCPLCKTNAECSGAKPECSTAKGECVACVTTAACPSGACDTAKNVCVECLVDTDCKGSKHVCDPGTKTCTPGCVADTDCGGTTPLCNTATHACIGCKTSGDCKDPNAPVCLPFTSACGCQLGAQCPSLSCNAGACCIAKTCSAKSCGKVDNGCGGTMECGTCATGACNAGTCQTLGTPCTVGANDCSTGEVCVFDKTLDGYACWKDAKGKFCAGASDCAAYAGNKSSGYSCPAMKCTANCLKTEDCAAGEKCFGYGGQPITPTVPGYCYPSP